MQNALITPQELQNILNDVVILDASMPQGGYALRHIEGAHFFDVDAVADTASPYPHMLPDAPTFAQYVSALGIGNDTHVVVYEQTGVSFAAARAWWMFRVFGHTRVQVLNGGLPAWMMAGGATVSTPTPPALPADFMADFQPDLCRSYEDVARISETGAEEIIDVRAAARFHAQMRTLDGDIIPAHIPGSINLPFAAVLDPMGGSMLTGDALEAVLTQYAPHTGKKRVTSCGSGITACVLALAFYEAGEDDVAVFDGSWTEWSDREFIR